MMTWILIISWLFIAPGGDGTFGKRTELQAYPNQPACLAAARGFWYNTGHGRAVCLPVSGVPRGTWTFEEPEWLEEVPDWVERNLYVRDYGDIWK